MRVRRARNAGKGRVPSGLAIGQTHQSAAEVVAAGGVVVLATGVGVYAYNSLTADEIEEEDVQTDVDRDIADDERLEDLETEIKAEVKAINRKINAVDRAKAKRTPKKTTSKKK